MVQESRTTKSIKNAQVNVIYYLIQIILGFWSRKVFYDYLGSEILGLDTTAQSLLQFLNIAESGVGAAVAYFLYSPFFNNDKEKIIKIVAIQGYIYKRIANLILVLALVVMLFFPWIFSDIKIPLWYAYVTFSVLLFGNLLGYYVNYKQSVLAADQKTYKVTRVTQLTSILFKVFLIFYLPYSSYPFYLYVSTTLLGSIIGCIWLNIVIKNEYPWLDLSNKNGRILIREFPEVLKKTKQLFVHKVAGYIVFYCSPLIMYSFSTLTIIAYYGNYLAITNNIKILLTQAFSSTSAAIGNLVASNDYKRMLSVFWELVDSRMCISTIIIFVLSIVTEPFITVWLSSKYLLGKDILFLILLNMWLFINRSTIDAFKDGFGIYQDIWAPFAEGTINLLVSIVAGIFWGIEGVLLGGIFSYIIVVYIWKPYYLFKVGFNIDSINGFFIPYIKRIILSVVFFMILYYIVSVIKLNIINYYDVFYWSILLLLISTVYFYVGFFIFTNGMKLFHNRIMEMIKNKIQ